MKAFMAFMRKELQEQLRSGRLLLLGILFSLFGVMNPAIAKLTPWIVEILADSLAASGMTVAEVHITALDSWVQFYKNIPMALIVFLCMEAGSFPLCCRISPRIRRVVLTTKQMIPTTWEMRKGPT